MSDLSTATRRNLWKQGAVRARTSAERGQTTAGVDRSSRLRTRRSETLRGRRRASISGCGDERASTEDSRGDCNFVATSHLHTCPLQRHRCRRNSGRRRARSRAAPPRRSGARPCLGRRIRSCPSPARREGASRATRTSLPARVQRRAMRDLTDVVASLGWDLTNARAGLRPRRRARPRAAACWSPAAIRAHTRRCSWCL